LVKLEVRTITPADATTLLSRTAPNRKPIRRRVAALADAMRAGQWQSDGAPVRIGQDGRLLDGQHRLMAVIEADTPAEFVVISGIDPQAQLVMDTGKPRSLEDHMHIQGVPNARNAAAAARFLWDYENGVITWRGDVIKRPAPTIPQLWQLYSARPDQIQEGAAQGAAVHRCVRMSKAVISGMWVVLSAVDFDDASEFYDRLAQRLQDGAIIDSIQVFTRRMNNQDRPSFGGALSARVQTAFLIKTWNAYRRGEPLSRLIFKPGGASAEKFPVPA
jgi:hypothetical protein